MSEVRLSIGGREYTVACAEGEEAHVTQLGGVIDAKLQQLGGNLSPQESQNLLFASLFLADELHEVKAAAEQAKRENEDRLSELQDQQREANMALGQRDELKLTISRLESELDGLQSAQQRHAAEVDDMRAELQSRREESESAREEVEKLVSQKAELQRECDALTSQIDNKDMLLDRANSHMNELKAQLKSAQSMPVTAGVAASSGSLADDPDLAPALERFADLLESCADKLESAAGNA
jgi:cell division protein ZapA